MTGPKAGTAEKPERTGSGYCQMPVKSALDAGLPFPLPALPRPTLPAPLLPPSPRRALSSGTGLNTFFLWPGVSTPVQTKLFFFFFSGKSIIEN